MIPARDLGVAQTPWPSHSSRACSSLACGFGEVRMVVVKRKMRVVMRVDWTILGIAFGDANTMKVDGSSLGFSIVKNRL